ncbi:recombinase family protein [Thalassobacillus sp. C254]|uniref:recombinase family protein n=1 Tax=Thalassobacillus sp. C254 TaxID=1225341 RepID=UPI0009FA0D7C
MQLRYARVSVANESLYIQFDSLKKEVCENIFTKKISGMKDDRSKLDEFLCVGR